MTRDELESVIWQRWPERGPKAGEDVDAILAAADAYAMSRPKPLAETGKEIRP